MGDASEFASFYRAYYPQVLRYAQRRVSDLDAAEELCAETFVVAWKSFDSENPVPLVWLLQTARNLIGNVYRKRAREQQLLVLLRQQASLEVTPTEFDVLSEALTGLGERDREALRLTYWEGLSAAEVGAVLDCSEQAAWKRISRAKSAVRAAMERFAEEGRVT